MINELRIWQGLMDRAYDKWKQNRDWSYNQFLLNLDSIEKKAVILGNFNSQVLNGGFVQWVDNGYASGGGRELLVILDEMGDQRVSQLVKPVLEHVDLSLENRGWGGDYWLNNELEMEELLEELNGLTDKYYDFYGEFELEVEEYLGKLKLEVVKNFSIWSAL